MTSPWEEYYNDAGRRGEEVRTSLTEDFPELVEILRTGEVRPVRLLCPKGPKGHRILTVTIVSDGYDIRLAPARDWEGGRHVYESGRLVAKNADPIASQAGTWLMEGAKRRDAPGCERVSWDCPKKGCGYHGVHRQDQLLRLYAEAVRHQRKEIRLPS